jgi:hypothetical protein
MEQDFILMLGKRWNEELAGVCEICLFTSKPESPHSQTPEERVAWLGDQTTTVVEFCM